MKALAASFQYCLSSVLFEIWKATSSNGHCCVQIWSTESELNTATGVPQRMPFHVISVSTHTNSHFMGLAWLLLLDFGSCCFPHTIEIWIRPHWFLPPLSLAVSFSAQLGKSGGEIKGEFCAVKWQAKATLPHHNPTSHDKVHVPSPLLFLWCM